MTGGLECKPDVAISSDRDVRWLEKPCLFLQRDGDKCSHCEEPFTFWRGKKHCEFCGCLFDSKCLLTTKLPTSFFKARMCTRCHQYKTFYAKILRHGGEFICYSSEIPAAARMSLSESKTTLTITVDPQEHFEISLDKLVCIQRGFSHSGHLKTASQYDPMRCFLITVKTGKQQTMTFDLKAHSAQHRDQWVIGLNNAKYVYDRLTEQNKALEDLQASGKKVPEDGWLGRRYLYFSEESMKSRKERARKQRGERRRSRSDGELTDNRWSSASVRPSSANSSLPRSLMEFEVIEHSDMVVVEEIYSDTSRGTSPAASIPSSEEDSAVDSPVVVRTHYKLRTGTIPDRAPAPFTTHSHHQLHHSRSRSSRKNNKDWQSKTIGGTTAITGLPYRNDNPLALFCECHQYAIEEPRAMLFPAKSPPRDPFSSCCEQCRDKCKVVRDLSNI